MTTRAGMGNRYVRDCLRRANLQFDRAGLKYFAMAASSRILLFTYGTRGDVEPFLALAHGLMARGYTVTLCTARRFEDRIKEFGIPFAPISDVSLDQMDTKDGKILLEGSSGRLARIVAGMRLARKSGSINALLCRDAWEAAKAAKPDLVVYHPKVMAAPHIAEAIGVPAIMGLLQPMIVPTKAFPPTGLPKLPIPGYTRIAYWLITVSYGAFRRSINRFRVEQLGLRPLRGGREVLTPSGARIVRILHAISPTVLPRPEDWPPEASVTGYWFLPPKHDYEPPDRLARFLDAGPAPVYIGFGSMMSEDPDLLLRIISGALDDTGLRCVVGSGWAGLEAAESDALITIPPVPHEWLFPRMAAVVHHGGAGTTAQGFRAGVPCVICPFFGDQPGWAEKSVALGVGAPPVPRRKLTSDALASSLRLAVGDPTLRENARALGQTLRGEDGVSVAVAAIEGVL
ncbi:glycosyltransferase [uncultured Tateyamaria sp.]|uniref:glycosyltransferase n=1 Tax=uncultured Tateyamaria sp. TaxID=455651 RepID=UPI00345D6423